MKWWLKSAGVLCAFWLNIWISAGQARSVGSAEAGPLKIPRVTRSNPRPITMSDLLTIRDCEGLSISPDGTHVAFVVGQAVYETNSYRSALFIVSTDSKHEAVNLGSAGLPHWDHIDQWIPEAPQWSPDSRSITYRMKRSAGETWQVWRWNRSSGRPIQITHVPGNVTRYHWTADGSRLVLTVQVNGDEEAALRLSEQGIVFDGTVHPWTGLPIVAQVLASRETRMETWIFDFVTRRERRATERETARLGDGGAELKEQIFPATPGASPKRRILDLEKSPDGKWLAFRSMAEDPDEAKPFEVDLWVKPIDGGEPVKLAPDSEGAYVGQYGWSRDSKTIFYSQLLSDGHAAKLLAVDRAGGVPEVLFREKDNNFCGDISLDDTARYGACVSDNNTTPPQIGLVDFKTGKVRTLVDLNPEFQNIQLNQPVRLEGRNEYGDSWFAHLVKPIGYESGKRYPLIVTTYRSGDYFLRGASGNENPIQVYAASGFVVLSFDVGLDSTVKSGDFRAKLLTWSSPTSSIKMAIRQLDADGLIDVHKVGISGYSHGAEIVAYALTHTDLFRAASGAGGYDPYFYYMSGEAWQKNFAAWGLAGWPEGTVRTRWEEIAPSLRAEQVHAAVLNNVPDTEYLAALSFYTSLKDLGTPVEMDIYPNELHVINQPKHRYEIYERNLDWFRFWLEEKEDSDPGKRAQYARWRKLRDQTGQR